MSTGVQPIELRYAGEDAALAALRRTILADSALQDRLAAIEDEDAFAEAVRAVAGCDHAAVLARALRPDPLGIDRFDTMPPDTDDWPSVGWLPGAVVATNAGPAVDWTHFGGAALTEPFFEDSLRRARRRPFNRLVRYRTPLMRLCSGAPADSLRAPDGLIFHMSRCGSTLVAQMLAADARTVAISEAPPLDGVVRFVEVNPDLSIEMRLGLIRAMVGALGRRSGGPFVVKLDSWHALALPLFRLAFPDTRWLFLYRDPVEVIVSHLRRRGSQMVPGLDDGLYGIADALGMPTEEYVARVLARLCEAIVAHHDPDGLVVRYDALPAAVADRILPHFGIAPDAAGRAAMTSAAGLDAKSPVFAFTPDGESKRGAAGDTVRRAAGRLAVPIGRLDMLRLASAAASDQDRRSGEWG